ncbi:hypothetical protein GHT06_020359 [Daphnia sinensis]|uniref:Uncharacterized protein n=1 Tax=Daphnia sinensis TaxID=1820382 RepID=A0AAD5PS94_9CRUS|nr:hypothetical protein GHT06_020359 [Daphnia sinensis]
MLPSFDPAIGLPTACVHRRLGTRIRRLQAAWPPPTKIAEPANDDPEVSPAKWIGSIQALIPHPIFALIQKSSDFIRIKRVVTWQLRFLRNYSSSPKKHVTPVSRWLTAPELRDAQTLLISVDKEHHFAVEIRFLRKGKPVPVTPKLATLAPFIDASGIIRVGGGIQHASLAEDTKHPIVLSSDSQLAAMIILDLHTRLTYAKTERLLHNLRTTYHVMQPEPLSRE